MLHVLISVAEKMFFLLGYTQFPHARVALLSFHVLGVLEYHSARLRHGKQILLPVTGSSLLQPTVSLLGWELSDFFQISRPSFM